MRAFKDYFKKSMEDVEVDGRLKKHLAHQLFSKTKKPFWTWPKMIFTAPSVVAIIAIALILTSSQPAIDQLLSPQEALAQALENTFDFETLELNFGLPQDGQFYHRELEYIHNVGNEIIGSYEEIMQLWTDSVNQRVDVLREPENSEFREFRSFLIDSESKLKCDLTLFKDCQSITKLQEEYAHTFLSGLDTHYPIDKEDLIDDLSIEITKNEKGFLYQISWSTLELLNGGAVIWSNNPSAGGASILLDNLNGGYTNKFENGKYWHLAYIPIDPGADSAYFQIETGHSWDDLEKTEDELVPRDKRLHSMIYFFDRNKNFKAISIKDFTSYIQKKYLYWGGTDDEFKRRFSAIFNALLSDALFDQPLFMEEVTKNQKAVLQIRYKIPQKYFSLFFSEVDENKADYFFDIFLDNTQSLFLGYTLAQGNRDIESLWIKDEILDDSQKNKIFNHSEWEKSIADEEKLKKPEQEEWFKASKQENL